MSFLESIKTSLRIMRANKGRTILTTLGIVVGMAAVIIVYSAGAGIYSLVVGQVENFGTDIIETEIKVPSNKRGNAGEFESAGAFATGVRITSLTVKDMEDVAKSSNVKAAYAAMMDQEQISYRNETRKAFVLGTSAAYINIDQSEIASGRWFSEAEDRALATVVVLGSKMKDKLFGDDNAIGKTVSIRQEKFLVIGVVKERGAVMFMDFDDYVYLPLRTLQKKVMGINHVSYIVHQLHDINQALSSAEEARQIIRRNHGISNPDQDDFRVVTMTESLATLKTVTDAVTWLLLGIVVISLIVGGVGIMNIMYVIVNERTSEIGLRKAVGATVADVMMQFLTESVLITLLGGVIGVSLGAAVAWLISVAAKSYGWAWQFSIPFNSLIVALIFSLVCGVLFGLYPARQAARLDPIEALRNE